MALVEKIATTGYRIVRTGLSGSAVPLARRNFVANGRRLVRSLAGIAFAALLMMVAVRNCDAVLDTVGGKVAQKSFAVLKPGGPTSPRCGPRFAARAGSETAPFARDKDQAAV
jgi:hypothetical protein